MNYKEDAIKRCSKIKDKETIVPILKDMLKTMYGLKDHPNRDNFATNFDYERKVLSEMFNILNKEDK